MPVNINLLPDEVIARGITPPDVGNFGTSLAATQDYFQKQAEQNLFSKGLPRVPGTNDIDWGEAGRQIAQLTGVRGISTALPLLNLQEQRNLPPIGSLTSPPPPPQQRPSPMPTSTSRPAGQATQESAPESSGNVATPLNTVQSTEVPGSAQISRDGEPFTPFPATKVATVPAGSAGAMEAPQFAPTPTNAPAADRFAAHPVSQRVAQAQTQPAPSQIPGIPTQQQGDYTEAEARRQDDIAARATEAARRADALNAPKGIGEDYRSVAAGARAKASAIREGQIKTQGEQGKIQAEQEKGILDESRKNYGAAQDVSYRLGLINNSIKEMGPVWLGPGANARTSAARGFNTALNFIPDAIKSEFGLAQISPDKVASWEDFNKQTRTLGFALAKSLGSREAVQVVQQATASVPNVEQSYWGARLVSASMQQAAQREIDYHKYLIQLKRGGQSLLDADVSFNQQNPVSSYVAKAVSVVPPQPAINELLKNPTPARIKEFNGKYGDGASIGAGVK